MPKSVNSNSSDNNREMQQSSSKRHNFQWTTRVGDSHEDDEGNKDEIKERNDADELLPQPPSGEKKIDGISGGRVEAPPPPAAATVAAENSRRKKAQAAAAIARLRSVLITAFGRHRQQSQQRVVLGTLFGNKRGYVHFAFQKDAKSQPTLLIQLATPITGLVREMSSGLVRIALETEKRGQRPGVPLLEEPSWRTYCNGTKCGQATRLQCGDKERKILKAVEPISMGAGVLPAAEGEGEGEGEEDVIYMRAKFERVVGSADSEALYMVNPDNNAAPELSIYLLRL